MGDAKCRNGKWVGRRASVLWTDGANDYGWLVIGANDERGHILKPSSESPRVDEWSSAENYHLGMKECQL